MRFTKRAFVEGRGRPKREAASFDAIETRNELARLPQHIQKRGAKPFVTAVAQHLFDPAGIIGSQLRHLGQLRGRTAQGLVDTVGTARQLRLNLEQAVVDIALVAARKLAPSRCRPSTAPVRPSRKVLP